MMNSSPERNGETGREFRVERTHHSGVDMLKIIKVVTAKAVSGRAFN